ncbi:hypothetical protein EVAR_34286_1 [Eumeta japonica]|uniref:Uncharacterized protein n=1 Tax=Eumeta variegata TaxID=151549 RepID=A0A4C1VXN9_EUMVA|nr:hypothetical protein EVAR_34286_1 [Eumeta japonica]
MKFSLLSGFLSNAADEKGARPAFVRRPGNERAFALDYLRPADTSSAPEVRRGVTVFHFSPRIMKRQSYSERDPLESHRYGYNC